MTILLCALLQVAPAAGRDLPALWEGLTPGPYAVGVRVRQGIDASRSYRRDANGVPVQLVLWYPAGDSPRPARRLTQLDYVMLSEPGDATEAKRSQVAESSANLATSWLHVGIVPQTKQQALAALDASNLAVLDAQPGPGRFPVVVIGSPYYLSTTAEFLASHGYLVASASYFGDAWLERPPPGRGMTYEPNLRTQEWALAELRGEPMADLRHVAALGHGGGGLSALLLAERNAAIAAVASLDGANFSSRSDWGEIPFAGTLQLRVPMLNLVRRQTRDEQDLYSDFARMRYSERYEVVLEDPGLRHHDLSNIGRGVSTALKLRGPEQAMVVERYAAMHRMLLAFLDQFVGGRPVASLERRLVAEAVPARVSVLAATIPAASVAEVVEMLSSRPASDALSEVRRQHAADPEAATFTPTAFAEMAQRLTRAGRAAAALELLAFGTELHPGSKEVAEAVLSARQAGGPPAPPSPPGR